MEMITFLVLGLGFGFLHALEPDHLVGVAAIASTTQNKWRAFFRGAVWGLGHTTTILVLYLLFQGLGLALNDSMYVKLESLVGFMLIFLGLRIWYKLIAQKYHFHFHNHQDDDKHLHVHSHALDASHEHTHLPFGIGVVHGLAGSGAIILALAIETSNHTLGAFYIILFGTGSCLSMGIFSGFLVASINKMGHWVNNFERVVLASVTIIATASCILGYEIIRGSGVF